MYIKIFSTNQEGGNVFSLKNMWKMRKMQDASSSENQVFNQFNIFCTL